MKCPKCGYLRQDRDDAYTPATECPACGIVYAKHDHRLQALPAIGAAPPPHLRPSPVAAVSLKKAKERVERRLRRQLEIQVKDERHEQTLKLARQIADAEIRRRLQTQNRHHTRSDEADDARRPAAEAFSSDAAQQADGTPADAVAVPAESPEVDGVRDTAETFGRESQHMHGSALEKSGRDRVDAEDDPDVHVETVILESAAIALSEPDETPPEAAESDHRDPLPDALDLDVLASAAHYSGGRVARLFPSIAWMALICGIVGAFLSWTTISSVEAGVNVPVPDRLSGLPLGLLLGFAYLVTGALGFAFFRVSSLIGRQLRDIRRLMLMQPPLAGGPEGPDPGR